MGLTKLAGELLSTADNELDEIIHVGGSDARHGANDADTAHYAAGSVKDWGRNACCVK